MSLILEALRKSEAERQREGAPSVAMELPPVAARNATATPGWVWPTLAAIIAVAILAGWLGLRAGKRDHAANVASTTSRQASPDQTALDATPGNAIRAASEHLPAAPVVVREAPSTPPTATAEASTAPQSTAQPTLPYAAIAVERDEQPPPPPPAPRPQPAAPTPAPAITPSDADAPSIGSTGLPPVKLSMHMWDADPAHRFVILDGQRMLEGDRNGELQVIAIRRNGVIIERNGIRARVPLP